MYKNKIEEIKYKTSESADEESVNMRIFFWKKSEIIVLGILTVVCIKN